MMEPPRALARARALTLEVGTLTPLLFSVRCGARAVWVMLMIEIEGGFAGSALASLAWPVASPRPCGASS